MYCIKEDLFWLNLVVEHICFSGADLFFNVRKKTVLIADKKKEQSLNMC